MELSPTCCNMSWQHVVCCRFSANMCDMRISRLNELCLQHVTSCHVSSSILLSILLSVFVECCDATKKYVEVMSHLSCWQHVMKCCMLLTLLPSSLLWWHTTIPTKVYENGWICNHLQGGPSEYNLQIFAKNPVQNTQQRAANFTMQVAMRNHETNLVDMPYNFIKEEISNLDLEDLDPSEELKLSGKCILKFGSLTNPMRKEERQITIKLKWKIS